MLTNNLKDRLRAHWYLVASGKGYQALYNLVDGRQWWR